MGWPQLAPCTIARQRTDENMLDRNLDLNQLLCEASTSLSAAAKIVPRVLFNSLLLAAWLVACCLARRPWPFQPPRISPQRCQKRFHLAHTVSATSVVRPDMGASQQAITDFNGKPYHTCDKHAAVQASGGTRTFVHDILKPKSPHPLATSFILLIDLLYI